MTNKILENLNPAQKQAIETISGPVLILAGPGSGKTRVITHRIAYLIKVCGIKPYRIMAVTFTNKAAREMKERLVKLVGEDAEGLTLGTFHAICAKILRKEGKAIGLEPQFTIYDDDDQISLIKQSLQELSLDPKQYPPRTLKTAIEAAKSHLLDPEQFASQTSSFFEEIVHRVYELYQQKLTQSKAVDFDDLLMKTVQLFAGNQQILTKYKTRFLHVMVDEFQDTNITQYEFIKQMAGKYRNLCVVGDPDQSIYSWRFADIRNIMSFEKDYPEAKIVVLEQNYRSTQTILDVATNIISANENRKPKKLVTENPAGAPITLVSTYSENEEAQYVVEEVDRLIKEEGLSPADCAVMYRVNALSRPLEEAFIRHGMSYKLVGDTRFYQRREVKDVVAYLRVLYNPSDSVSLNRIVNVPNRGIGDRTMAELSGFAKSQDMSLYLALKSAVEKKEPPLPQRAFLAVSSFVEIMDKLAVESKKLNLSKLVEMVVEKTGYHSYIINDEGGEERWENIRELRNAAGDYDGIEPEEALAAFMENVSLISDIDELGENQGATVLTTLHKAKGLEFEIVFITGMEEGLLPHRKSLEDKSELEEERRLCYVGVTRAKKKVYLLYSNYRNLFGAGGGTVRSRFIDDIPKDLMDSKYFGDSQYQEAEYVPVTEIYSRSANNMQRPEKGGEKKLRAFGPKPQQPPNESIRVCVGDRVRHRIFGEGVVMSCTDGQDQQATITFDVGGTKRLLLSFAPLEKV